ncbi:hypothetical protein NFC81_12845 [Salinispirillum sp. LH 10-3-1]|uniref:Histidine kinase/HSP90-like ATPase domain-containing protein n=1 Tax=Salinispirillum sp. LH 10-3-1 TaxID=2952525 RepID=A0AB38YE25_9GAMM
MSTPSSRRHKTYRPLVFVLLALSAVAAAGWVGVTQNVPVWIGALLGITTIANLIVGTGFLLTMNSEFSDILRQQGNLNRRIQEAHLEQERLSYEVAQGVKLRRQMHRKHDEQSRATLKVADVLNAITTEVQISAASLDLGRQTASKLDYMTQISSDLIELVQLEIEGTRTEQDDFLVVDSCRRVIRSLQVAGSLSDSFVLETEDQDVRGLLSRRTFESLIQRCLLGLVPFAEQQRIDGQLISFIHGDLGDCIRITLTAHGHGITDEEAEHWFSQFQLHYGNDGELLGPGLGMMIVGRYIDALGGVVSIDSQLDNRMTIELTVPLNATTTEVPEPD